MNAQRVSPSQLTYVNLVAGFGAQNLPPGGEATLAKMLEWVPADSALIVDLGANTGWSTVTLAATRPAAHVIGVDVSAEMVERANSKYADVANVSFVVGDAAQPVAELADVDAVVCAGSTAFFADQVASYRAARRMLRTQGVFVNAHYVYDPNTPIALRAAERESFGVVSIPYSAAECLADYDSAGLIVQEYRRLPRWHLPDRGGAEVYRDILKSIPALSDQVDQVVARRELVSALTPFRYPAIVASVGSASQPPRDARLNSERFEEVLKLFTLPFAAQPMSRLRRMLPYEFLAYVGDPDAAPGGAASVQKAAELLTNYGVPPSAQVLDVGSFTGMSTFVLAESFPDVLGIDLDPVFVEAARRLGAALKSAARFSHLDARELPMPTDSYDAVVMTATLGYSPSPQSLISEAFRVLKPGGYFVEFLYHHHLRSAEHERNVRRVVGPDIRLETIAEQVGQIEDEGFRLVQMQRLPVAPASERATDEICWRIVDVESRRNPHLDGDDLTEFAGLVAKYMARDFPDVRSPEVYLCLFTKPDLEP